MKLRNFFTAIKNNPKKSIFFGGLLGFGVNYGISKYDEECLMRKYCYEALEYGEVSQHYTDTERHITVLLNPAANNNKCRKNYDKYCAPLLHLSGIKVALVRTEHEGQAKELMNIMDNTDAVVIAGGDGTLQEALTGLLRREDVFDACRKFPFGLLPLGVRNMCASSLWNFDGKPQAKDLAHATMDIIKNVTRKLSVMELTPVETNADEPPKAVYAATNLEWSAYRDAYEKMDKYWYWGPLKKYMTYIFSSYKDLSWKCDCTIQYSSPCSGCQKCKALEIQRQVELEQLKKLNARWWHSFLPRGKPNPEEVTVNYDDIVNEDCGKMKSVDVEDVHDIQISSKNTKLTNDIPDYALAVQLGSENIGASTFIKEGIDRARGENPNFNSKFVTGEILLEPKPHTLKDKQGNDRELNIDNSNFEVKPMRIRPIENAITIFASKQIPVS